MTTKTIARLVVGLVFLGTAGTANALVIEGTVEPFSVDYIFFGHSGGALDILVEGITTGPNDELTDPMIRLYEDDGSPLGALTGAFEGVDDDGGPGFDSLLSFVSLAADDYVLAIGQWYLSDSEARSGIASSPSFAGDYRATFRPDVVLASVPEPATLTLMAVGLAGIGFARRTKA